MGVKNFMELRCWEQSSELKKRMYAICAREPACRDRDFWIARGSLGEIQDALIDAKDRRYVYEAEFKEVWEISERAIASTTGMMKYLQENKDRRFWGNGPDG